MKITADTITDEQIRRLRDHALAYGNDDVATTCNDALVGVVVGNTGGARVLRAARARCAEILNAREVQP